jgi:hypothetical protein
MNRHYSIRILASGGREHFGSTAKRSTPFTLIAMINPVINSGTGVLTHAARLEMTCEHPVRNIWVSVTCHVPV